jgi:hypothetical protein
VLQQVFPYILIPPLPQRSEETKEEELPKRLKVYNRFLKSVCKSEVLKSCVFLLQFVQTADRKDWETQVKFNQKLKFARRIEDVVSNQGQVCTEAK